MKVTTLFSLFISLLACWICGYSYLHLCYEELSLQMQVIEKRKRWYALREENETHVFFLLSKENPQRQWAWLKEEAFSHLTFPLESEVESLIESSSSTDHE